MRRICRTGKFYACGKFAFDEAASLPHPCGMETGYHDALMQTAQAYSAAVATHGGKSLSRVATIVVNRGSFFERLQQDVSFSVRNLERFAEWFRNAENWPRGEIPQNAAEALSSMGRPPVIDHSHSSLADRTVSDCGAGVVCDRHPISHSGAGR
jgi:hypothetical protein